MKHCILTFFRVEATDIGRTEKGDNQTQTAFMATLDHGGQNGEKIIVDNEVEADFERGFAEAEVTIAGLSAGSRYLLRLSLDGLVGGHSSSSASIVEDKSPQSFDLIAETVVADVAKTTEDVVMVFVEASSPRSYAEEETSTQVLLIPINDPIRLLPIIGEFLG